MKTLNDFLLKHNACADGYNFAKDLTFEQFLNTCERGDWILWLFKKMNPDSLRELYLAKGLCANTVRHLMKDERSKNAVDIAIKFGKNQATRQELDAADAADADAAGAAAAADAAAAIAAIAADAVAADVAAAAAADAAGAAAAADAADAADAVAADAAAADAADAAAAAAADAAGAAAAIAAIAAAAKKQNQKLTADICRKYLPLNIWDQSQL